MGKSEEVILVDARNRRIGSGEKLQVHQEGLRHRAFSIFLIDPHGAVVLQKRHPGKYHSGGLWANTCCGHPRPGEATIAGASRRLFEEVGVRAELTFAFRSRYAVRFANGLVEHELDHVFAGRFDGAPALDPDEADGAEWVDPDALAADVRARPDRYTAWLALSLQGAVEWWRRSRKDPPRRA